MVLVVPNICRYTLNGTVDDRPWANVLDMRIEVDGPVFGDRTDAIWDTAGNIINEWASNIAPLICKGTFLNSVSWVDLDSENGQTGERVATSLHTLPVEGGNEGLISPGNVAILITKQVTSGRGQRNGRMYQAGVADGQTDGNSVEPTVLPVWQNAFDSFLLALNDTPVISDFNRHLMVVHTTADGTVVTGTSEVDQLVVSGRPATQRRRLRG